MTPRRAVSRVAIAGLLCACTPSARPDRSVVQLPVGRLTLIGSARIAAGDSVALAVRIRNDGPRDTTVNLGACSLSISMLRPDASTPLWEHERWQQSPGDSPGAGRMCPLYRLAVPMKPGETVSPSQLETSFAIKELLADSLSPGTYRFDARVSLGDTSVTMSLGTLTLGRR